jgi:type I restriction enzyme R subunit
VEDGAVVPILYEGRLVEMRQDKEAVDLWFERQTSSLAKGQKADLKKKYARAYMLQKADRVVYMRAFDISRHFADTWKGTPFKGQLVAPSKLVALQYKKYLDEFGELSSEVVISPPDEREGYEETESEPKDEVKVFWDRMMRRWGDEPKYVKGIINQFKYGEEPEIIIVVDKLLTGFDAPRNTVLYLCRVLREHTLLQAIARVNRLYEGKDFGYVIDYAGALGELDEALSMYQAFEEYDEADLVGAVLDIEEELRKLPQRRSDLWELFKTLGSTSDEEAYERYLGDDDRRREFYARLSAYLKAFSIALFGAIHRGDAEGKDRGIQVRPQAFPEPEAGSPEAIRRNGPL